MELLEFLRALRARWRWVVGGLVLGLAVAGVVTLTTTRQYEAETELFVSTGQSTDGTELFSGSSFTQQRVKSYTQVVTTPRVLDPVIRDLGLDTTAADLAAAITVTVPLDTVLVDISVRDPDADRAARIANAVSASFTTVVDTLERVGDTPSPVRISSVRDAVVPESPVLPSVPLNLALGLLVGLLLGGAAALVRQLLDTAVRSEKDVLALAETAVLGEIPFDRKSGASPTRMWEAQGVRSEAFRTLRTNLQFVDAVGRLDSLVVTSSVPQEGKSTTVINLALACVNNGLSVCVVDADLRRPQIAHYLGLFDTVGLTTVLLNKVTVEDALQQWGEAGLSVLTAGETPPNPSELISTPTMESVVDDLRARFDLVIIDAPPLLPVTDAVLLSAHVGGVLMVAGAGKVRREELRRSLRLLDTAGARLLGVVLNLLPPTPGVTVGYYGYATDPHRRRHRKTAEDIPEQDRSETVPPSTPARPPSPRDDDDAHTVRIRPVRAPSRRAR